MRNIKLTIEYDGTHFAGWQVQKSRSQAAGRRSYTIQETIEKALQKVLQEKVKLIASGRTDAGVHARAQVANFKTSSKITPKKLIEALNALLPDDISVGKVEEAGLDFHSRFSCRAKAYRYTVLNQPHRSALLREKAYFLRYPLDMALMRKEAGHLLGRHDFKAFQASAAKHKNSIKTIRRLDISRDKNLIHIDIEADGFLYNMVRSIAGTLIEIGRGRFPEGSLKKILESKNRKLAGPTAPACGLCLMKVTY